MRVSSSEKRAQKLVFSEKISVQILRLMSNFLRKPNGITLVGFRNVIAIIKKDKITNKKTGGNYVLISKNKQRQK